MPPPHTPPESKSCLQFIGSTPVIPTTEYDILEVECLPEQVRSYYKKNTATINNLLRGRLDHQEAKQEGGVFNIYVIYPQDASGKENPENNKNGKLRAEELITFSSIDPETGKIYYICRSRPEGNGLNTPGKLDPGVLSHGGLEQAGVVNAWRYVADKLGKDDTGLRHDEYTTYLEDHSFPQNYALLDGGAFILANGSNERNKNKKSEDTFETRTSALIQVRTTVLSYTHFQQILQAQNNTDVSTRYTATELSDRGESSWSIKHQAVHKQLLRIRDQIQTETSLLQREVSNQIYSLL